MSTEHGVRSGETKSVTNLSQHDYDNLVRDALLWRRKQAEVPDGWMQIRTSFYNELTHAQEANEERDRQNRESERMGFPVVAAEETNADKLIDLADEIEGALVPNGAIWPSFDWAKARDKVKAILQRKITAASQLAFAEGVNSCAKWIRSRFSDSKFWTADGLAQNMQDNLRSLSPQPGWWEQQLEKLRKHCESQIGYPDSPYWQVYHNALADVETRADRQPVDLKQQEAPVLCGAREREDKIDEFSETYCCVLTQGHQGEHRTRTGRIFPSWEQREAQVRALIAKWKEKDWPHYDNHAYKTCADELEAALQSAAKEKAK